MRMRAAILAGLLSGAVPAGNALASDAPVSEARTVLLGGRDITLGDIASTMGTGADPAWVVSRMAEGRSEMLLSAGRREQLVRRRVPGIALPLLQEGPVRFQLDPKSLPERPADETGCLLLKTSAPRGTFLSRSDLAEGECAGDQARQSVVFDRNAGTLRSVEDLPAGTAFGMLQLPEAGLVQPGTQMQLVVREGPVTVSREVETLQPALPGRPVFVRTADGEIFAAPLTSAGGGE